MKAAWVNDIHLEFLDHPRLERFLCALSSCAADCILIAGDIAQAPSVADALMKMDAALQRPIYFVLGNHDFYHGSISGVRSSMQDVATASHSLHWLNKSGVIRLTEKTTVIGHDGWGDGRLWEFHNSQVQLNDFILIQELAGLKRQELLRELHTLGDETAGHLKTVLPEALAISDHIVVVTHVPPFLEAAWFDGRYCDSDWLPFFACKAAGDVLQQAMREHPDKQMTVLCGHTHGGGRSRILPNLVTHTGPADYGCPVVQEVFEWN